MTESFAELREQISAAAEVFEDHETPETFAEIREQISTAAEDHGTHESRKWDEWPSARLVTHPIVYQKPPQIMSDLAKFLKSRGHQCVAIVGSDNHRFLWCEEEECPTTRARKAMSEQQDKEDAFVDQLQAQGHTCITISERYPSSTNWCEQTPCVNLKKTD